MDATVKQRILGVIVLVGLLGFCLTVLLRNTKTQPHIPKINTQPVLTQTLSPVETPNSVFTKPEAKPAPLTFAPATKKDSVPAPVAVAPAPITAATPVVAQPVLQAPQDAVTQNRAKTPNAKTQNMTSLQQPDSEVDLTGTSATASATSATIPTSTATPTIPTATTPSQTTIVTATTEKPHHKQQQHHAVIAATAHKKETSKSTATSGDQKNMMVQVGTFSLPANADTLVEKLHKKGFSAVGEKMKTSKGEMTRVIVGKKGLDHAQAETLRKDLEKSMHLTGIIVSHAKN